VDTAAWQRVAGNAAMAYGFDTIGVADTVLDRMRGSAATTASAPGGGKQKDMSLWFADMNGLTTDPSFAAHELPITSVARAAWECWWGPDTFAHSPSSLHSVGGWSNGASGASALGLALKQAHASLRTFEWA